MGLMDSRVVLVTGAGRGIGRATALRLASEGAIVQVADIERDRAEAVASEILAAGGQAQARAMDVTDVDAWVDVVAAIAADHDRLDVLVNNAGITVAKFVEDTSLEDWRRIMTTNVESQFLGVKAALPLLKQTAATREHGGAIVCMSSVSGIIGTPVLAAYTASKAAVRYFCKSIALDFARKGYKIRANSVHPGSTEGESANEIFGSRVRAGLSPSIEQAEKDWIANYPIGRIGTQLDVANAILFLASDQSAFITGTELVVDGGLSAQ